MIIVHRPAALTLAAAAFVLSFVALRAQDAVPPAGAKTWIGHAAEMEAYLKIADIDRMEGTSVGVTKPRHVFLKTGGPFARVDKGTYTLADTATATTKPARQKPAAAKRTPARKQAAARKKTATTKPSRTKRTR